jgi:enoyl-CoA hydratase/carnithine racemase
MMAQDGLTVSNEAGVMTITLDRPEKLNAYTDAMGRALARSVRAASEDDAIRAIIITGAGRAFCAGADVSAGAESFDMAGEGARNFGGRDERRSREDSFIHALFESKKPIIAAINGPAVGVGITLTLPCDVRIAAEGARIGFVFARRGLVPEAGSAWFLPRLVGLPQALRWCLSGRVFDAGEALAGGLVSEVVPANCCPAPAPSPPNSARAPRLSPLHWPVPCFGGWAALPGRRTRWRWMRRGISHSAVGRM